MARTHGQSSTYRTGCRCADCTEANRLKAAQFRKDKKVAPSPNLPHGTYSGYSNHGCRCDLCREAARTHRARYRRSK